MRFILLALLPFIGLTMAEIGRASYAGSLPLVLPEATTSGGNEEITGSNATGYKKDEKPESTSTTSSSSTSSSTTTTEKDTGLVQEIISELPVTLPPILQELDGPKRRVITYDQRQEGQYNIRADLDNFMFLLIPAAPVASDSFNILDIFGKSGSRRTAHSSLKTNKKKHYSPLKGEAFKTDASSIKYRQAMKNADYLPRSGDHQPSRVGEFIEGRTPYHVDISAINGDEVQARLNPDRQVDVLPPPAYPLAYQHLMKPYLEADSSIIQTLPPAELQNRQNSGK